MKHFAMRLALAVLVLGASDVGAVQPPRTHLPAPTAVTCPVRDGTILAAWAVVDGATKYSVDVVAGFDTSTPPDGVVDATVDFDFGTSDRTDGAPISQPDLAIPLSALTSTFTLADGTTVVLDPIAVSLRVKALHPGRGQGPQNNPFSGFCEVTLP